MSNPLKQIRRFGLGNGSGAVSWQLEWEGGVGDFEIPGFGAEGARLVLQGLAQGGIVKDQVDGLAVDHFRIQVTVAR